MVELPTKCPVCGKELSWEGVDLICTNPECDNIKEQDLIAWTGILGSVDGLAWKTKKKYFDELNIKSIEDLENYIKDRLDNDADRYQSITDKKIFQMFNLIAYCNVDLELALQALNIERLGSESAKKIANDKECYDLILSIIKNKDENIDWSLECITKVVGPATMNAISQNRKKLYRLNYIKIKPFIEKEKVETVGTFCVTGKLEKMKRNDLVKLAEEKGWKSLGGVNKDCNYLVTNDTTSGSSKNKKAQELGTKIITENEFYDMLGI